MARSARWTLVALIAWTLFVWPTRIRNALGDDTLSAGSKAFSVVLSLTFVAFALAGIVIAVRAWRRPLLRGETLVLWAFAGWTTVVWLIRVPMILLDGRSAAFHVVHAMLGLVSVGLSVGVWRTTQPAPAAAEGEESRQPAARR